MNKIRISKEYFWLILVFLIIACIYVTHAPRTVQTGDSGELAAAAFKLLVAHPPGYPVWIWINHLWLEIFNFGSVYFSLSIFNIAISLATLGLIAKCVPSPFVRILSVMTLGFSLLYWKFSMIPEVFILNLFFVFAIIYSGNYLGRIGGTTISAAPVIMPILFSLALANHHTVIFLMPYVLWICWQHKRSVYLYASIAIGIVICASLYLSMLKMHPESVHSWGDLKTPQDVLNHLLRKDYGTFALHPNPNKGAFHLLFAYFLEQTALTALPIILFTFFILAKTLKNRTKLQWSPFNSAVTACLCAYLFLFLPMMQMAPMFSREEMVERFFLLPIALLVFLMSKFIAENYTFDTKIKMAIPLVIISVTGYLSFTLFSDDNDYSENTIVADYALNMLNTAAEFKNPIIFSSMDTEAFSLRYAQAVDGVQPGVLVASNFAYMLEPKVVAQFPQINFKINFPDPPTKGLSFADDVVAPNEKNSTIISDQDEFSPNQVKVTYLPIGAVITTGKGVSIQKTDYLPQFHSDASIIKKPYAKFDLFRNIFVKYTYYFNAKAMKEVKEGNFKAAIDSLERALAFAPFEKHALINLCKIKKEQNLEDKKCQHVSAAEEWFDYYKYNKSRIE